MTIEQFPEPLFTDEESKENRELLEIFLLAIELALENPKNLQRLQEIWKANDPVYKKWLEEKKRPSESVAETQKA